MRKHISSLLLIIITSSFSLLFSAAISYESALDNYAELFSPALSDDDRLAFVSFDSLDEELSLSIVSALEEKLINKGVFVVAR